MRHRPGADGHAGLPRLACLAVGLTVATAFDNEAHDAIGQTAASGMDQEAIKNVKRLLDGQDVSDVAAWGHQADDTFPGLARLHFQVHDSSVQPHCGNFKEAVPSCKDDICLLQAIKHFYGKVLKDEGRSIVYPEIDYEKVEKGIKFTDADSVKMLINLMGDLHQPLHVGYSSDDNGHEVQVKFNGKQMSLYEFWDKAISEEVRTKESGFWYGGWTHIRAVQSEFEKDKELWKKGSGYAFDAWLEDTMAFACKTAYVLPSTGKKLVGEGAPTQPIEISAADYRQWKEGWLRQILLAGARTAIVLNDILDVKAAAKLKTGSAVNTDADKDKAKEQLEWDKEREKMQKAEAARPRSSGPWFNPHVLFKNMVIAAFTVPLFLAFVNHGMNPQVYYELAMGWLDTEPKATDAGAMGRAGKRTL